MKINLNLIKNFKKNLHHGLAVDLGSNKIIVYLDKKGIVFEEKSIVAVNNKTKQIIAIGQEAQEMLGKTPSYISIIEPLEKGVISNFEIAEKLLRYILTDIKEKHNLSNFFFNPNIIVGVNANSTEVQLRAAIDMLRNAGGKNIYLIEKPLSIAIGCGLLLTEAKGHLIVDIGAGITEVSVVSLGGIVVSKNTTIAGNKFNQDIVQYIKSKFKLAIGVQTAEIIKTKIGNAIDLNKDETLNIKGRDLITGLPKEIKITSDEAREALLESLDVIIQTIKNVIEETPPELISDIIDKGILVTGKSSKLKGIKELIEKHTGLKVNLIDNPKNSVIKGEGSVLENFQVMKTYLLNEDGNTSW